MHRFCAGGVPSVKQVRSILDSVSRELHLIFLGDPRVLN